MIIQVNLFRLLAELATTLEIDILLLHCEISFGVHQSLLMHVQKHRLLHSRGSFFCHSEACPEQSEGTEVTKNLF